MRQKSGKIVGMLAAAVAFVMFGGSVQAGSIISDGDFGLPNIHGGVSYTPNSYPFQTPWLYSAHVSSTVGAGVAASGVYKPLAPNGQAGFVEGGGSSISQYFAVPSTGNYAVTFFDEGRYTNLADPFSVELNGKKIGATQTPAAFKNFTQVTVLLNKLNAGTAYNLSFVGLGVTGKSKDVAISLIDNVSIISSVPAPRAFVGGLLLLSLCGVRSYWMRRQTAA